MPRVRVCSSHLMPFGGGAVLDTIIDAMLMAHLTRLSRTTYLTLWTCKCGVVIVYLSDFLSVDSSCSY